MQISTCHKLRAKLSRYWRTKSKLDFRVALGLAAQLLQLGTGLVLMPFVLTRLQPADLGLWYVFFAIQALVALIDFGFSQTFARNFAYVFAGAQRLSKVGFAESSKDAFNSGLLVATIAAARWVYFIIAGIAIAFLGTAGTAYVMDLATKSHLDRQAVLLSWSIFSIAVSSSVYFQWQSSLLTGADRVIRNYLITIVSRLVQLMASIIGLLWMPSLLALVCAYAASVVVARIYGYVSVKDLLPDRKLPYAKSPQSPREIFVALWHNASRLGLVFIGAFLITRFNIFAVAYFLGLAVSGQFAVTSQILMVAQGLAQVAYTAYFPQISRARIAGDLSRVRTVFLASLLFAWFVFCCCAITAIVLGPWALALIDSKTTLPSTSVLILMALVYLLEMNHSLCATTIVSGNHVPFVRAALVSGVTIALGTLAVGMAGCSLIVYVAVQAVIQLSYNNWKWPISIFSELQIKRSDILHFFPKMRRAS